MQGLWHTLIPPQRTVMQALRAACTNTIPSLSLSRQPQLDRSTSATLRQPSCAVQKSSAHSMATIWKPQSNATFRMSYHTIRCDRHLLLSRRASDPRRSDVQHSSQVSAKAFRDGDFQLTDKLQRAIPHHPPLIFTQRSHTAYQQRTAGPSNSATRSKPIMAARLSSFSFGICGVDYARNTCSCWVASMSGHTIPRMSILS